MTDESFQEICCTLSPIVEDTDTHSWEETTDASLTDLLRGPLARSAKERAVQPSISEPFTRCDNLKKHIKVVLDRIESAGGIPSMAGLSIGAQ
jgi:hypothetical protein